MDKLCKIKEKLGIDREYLIKLPLIERAMIVATICHSGVKDKGGSPYLFHPINVALMLETEEEKVVGILHDTVEDTELTFDDLRDLEFPERIVKGVESVTKRRGEKYMDFVSRSKGDPIGRNVKIKDIKHNSDIRRIPNPKEKDLKRLEKYKKAEAFLTDEVASDKSNITLYIFKVKDYTTILIGQMEIDECGEKVFYVQRGDGDKYKYDGYRVEWYKEYTVEM